MQQPNQHIFTDARLPDDINLVDTVAELLIQNNCPQDRLNDYYYSNHYIHDARNLRPEAQRFLLNRYWNLQLLSINKSSIEERYCLISNGEFEDWLKLFSKVVIPFVIENNLPTAI